jgi:hypothetical protein
MAARLLHTPTKLIICLFYQIPGLGVLKPHLPYNIKAAKFSRIFENSLPSRSPANTYVGLYKGVKPSNPHILYPLASSESPLFHYPLAYLTLDSSTFLSSKTKKRNLMLDRECAEYYLV